MKVKCVECENFKNFKGTTDYRCIMGMIFTSKVTGDGGARVRIFPLLGKKASGKHKDKYLYYRGRKQKALNRNCQFFKSMED